MCDLVQCLPARKGSGSIGYTLYILMLFAVSQLWLQQCEIRFLMHLAHLFLCYQCYCVVFLLWPDAKEEYNTVPRYIFLMAEGSIM
jgi:cbb3-type cytochrome oxidase subunit 3